MNRLPFCVGVLSLAGVSVFITFCVAATHFPEGSGLRIDGPGGIRIEAILGMRSTQERNSDLEKNR